MKFGICNETFGDWQLDRALEFARNAGYTGWEVAPFMLTDDVPAYTVNQRSEYRRCVEQAGLKVIGLHWLLAQTDGLHLTTPIESVRRATSDYLCELTRFCSDLGGHVMVLGSPQQRNFPVEQTEDSAMQFAADVLRDVVPELESRDVRIALEPLGPEEGNFLNTAADARVLQTLVDSEHVQLHLDVKAMSTEAKPITQIIRDNADAMIHFHANDPNRRGPGMGDIEFAPIFDALREIDYDEWVSVEVFDYAPGVERLVNESMNQMKSALGQ